MKKKFNIGDKVWAKLKGYPHWPAIIEDNSLKSKKYKVKFYGTGEIGQIRPEDVFYYIANKQNLTSNTKRKFLPEAIKEIEEAIKEAGTDGDSGQELVNESEENESDTNKQTNADDNKAVKRGRSISSDQKLEADSDKSNSAEDQTMSSIENTAKKIKLSSSLENLAENSHVMDVTDKEETSSFIDETDNKTTTEETEIKEVTEFLFEEDLEIFINYAAHVKKKSEIYQNMAVEPRNNFSSYVIPFMLPGKEKCVGFKFGTIWKNEKFDSEYDQAMYDKESVEKFLNLKYELINDSAQSKNLITLDFTEKDLEDIFEERNRKVEDDVFEKIKIEHNLLIQLSKIMKFLSLDKAEPKEAYKCLEEIYNLELTAVMLKKHQRVADVIRRLRRYVGNTSHWQISEEEIIEFEKDAAEIRSISDKVFLKFLTILQIDISGDNLWEKYMEFMDEFKENTREFSEGQICQLIHEPFSREAFFVNHYLKDIHLDVNFKNISNLQ